MHNCTIISLAVQKSGGGPTKTIGAFKLALDGQLYSFCDKARIVQDPLAIEGAKPVYASKLPLARQFLWSSMTATRAVDVACRESRFVSCHSFYRYHTLWMNRMFRKYGTPYWFVPHGILDPWVLESGRVAKKLFWDFGGRRFLDNASTVIFSTKAERDKALTLFDVPNSDIVPWPVEVVDRNNHDEARRRIRSQYQIPEEHRVLIYFGRLHHMKRPIETIRALAESGCQSVHLMVVGNEQTVTLHDCYQAAEECGVSDRVHLIGPVYGQEKYDYLFASDAYISLSFRENFNHTAAESLSASLPAILSEGNDLYSEISDINCSWRLNGDDVNAAAESIRAFSSCDSSELRKMGERGRLWVQDNLSFKKFKESMQFLVSKYERK